MGEIITFPELQSIGTFVWQSFMNREKQATTQKVKFVNELWNLRVKSPTGRELYRKRKYMVEPVFGNMKHNMRFRSFLKKGKENCEGEFFLAALVHNIKKLIRFEGIVKIKEFATNIIKPSRGSGFSYIFANTVCKVGIDTCRFIHPLVYFG